MRYQEIVEAVATDAMKQKTYYHGTPHEDKGQSILQMGIVPGNQQGHARGHLTPIVGRTYVTSSLRYGVVYCIGGNMLGCPEDSVPMLIRDRSQHGWLFVVYGKTFVDDIQPDEDSVGEAAMYADIILNREDKSKFFYQREPLFQGLFKADRTWLQHFHYNARSSMTPRQWRDAIDGLIAAQAAGGKRFLKRMLDTDKLNLINSGAHVAYKGNLVPDEAWRFDKTKTPQLQKDGSNFFQLAERVR